MKLKQSIGYVLVLLSFVLASCYWNDDVRTDLNAFIGASGTPVPVNTGP